MSTCRCPGLNGETGQNGHPPGAADGPSQSCKACHDWDILNLTQGRVLPELGHEVSALEPQASILSADHLDHIGALSLCQLATIEGHSRHGDRRHRELARRLAGVHCHNPKCDQDDPQQLHYVSAEPQRCMCLPRLT